MKGYFAEDFHHNIDNTAGTTSFAISFYPPYDDNLIGTGYRSPLPQKVQLAPQPKKQPVLALRKAKEFKRLKAWGLRK